MTAERREEKEGVSHQVTLFFILDGKKNASKMHQGQKFNLSSPVYSVRF